MLLNVQALRALAAFLVVFVHIERLAELMGLPRGITTFGNSGVDVFFVISGLIMVMTTQRESETAGEFLRKRIVRIVPLYWSVTLAVFAIAVFAPSLLQSTTASAVQLLKSLAFVPYPRLDGEMHPVVFVGWTLNYEMMFYVLFAVGLLVPRRTLGVALTVGMLALAVAFGQIAHPTNPVLAFYTWPIMLEFGAGMLIGLMLVRKRLPSDRRSAFVALAAAAIAFVVMLLGPTLWPTADRSLMFGLPAAVIVTGALIAEQAGFAVRSPGVQLLGAASYAIYLTHFFCTQLVVFAAIRFARFGSPALVALAVLAFVLVAAVGIAVHLKIEKPLTAGARRLLKARRGPVERTIPGGAW